MGSFNFENGQLRKNTVPQPAMPAAGSVENIADGRPYPNGPVGVRSPIYSNHLLRQLPVSVLRKLRPHMGTVAFTGGEYIYRPDEDIDWIYFPETTAVSDLQILEDGRTIEVSLTGREGMVGIQSFLGRARSPGWIQVCVPGTAVRIRSEVLRKEIGQFDWIVSLFHEAVQSYIVQLSQKVACNAHHSVEERFAAWLLMLQDRCGTDRLKLTQEHIARVLGVYRPSVTCIAQEMRKRGLIEYVRGTIMILDRESLDARSCGCFPKLAARPTELKLIGGNRFA